MEERLTSPQGQPSSEKSQEDAWLSPHHLLTFSSPPPPPRTTPPATPTQSLVPPASPFSYPHPLPRPPESKFHLSSVTIAFAREALAKNQEFYCCDSTYIYE